MYVARYDCQGWAQRQNFFHWMGSYDEKSYSGGTCEGGRALPQRELAIRASILVLKGRRTLKLQIFYPPPPHTALDKEETECFRARRRRPSK